MTNILVVCTGNICRSPLGEVLLRARLAESGVDHVNVSSAGTGAWDGSPASEGALLVGLEHGVDLSAHRARLLTRELVRDADLILTMARHQRSRVEDLGGQEKVHVIGEYAGRSGPEAEVADPFGGSMEVYRDTFAELDDLTAVVAQRISDELQDDADRH